MVVSQVGWISKKNLFKQTSFKTLRIDQVPLCTSYRISFTIKLTTSLSVVKFCSELTRSIQTIYKLKPKQFSTNPMSPLEKPKRKSCSCWDWRYLHHEGKVMVMEEVDVDKEAETVNCGNKYRSCPCLNLLQNPFFILPRITWPALNSSSSRRLTTTKVLLSSYPGWT